MQANIAFKRLWGAWVSLGEAIGHVVMSIVLAIFYVLAVGAYASFEKLAALARGRATGGGWAAYPEQQKTLSELSHPF